MTSCYSVADVGFNPKLVFSVLLRETNNFLPVVVWIMFLGWLVPYCCLLDWRRVLCTPPPLLLLERGVPQVWQRDVCERELEALRASGGNQVDGPPAPVLRAETRSTVYRLRHKRFACQGALLELKSDLVAKWSPQGYGAKHFPAFLTCGQPFG